MLDAAMEQIRRHAHEGALLREEFFTARAGDIVAAAQKIAECLRGGGKILLCGNGGSAADAQHLAAEFVNRFLIDRRALPAVALTTDTSILTAVGNDSDFRQVFARQVEALGKDGDILFAISTSGNSGNVIAAIEAAQRANMVTIGLTGQGGGAMAHSCTMLFDVPSRHTPLIQEIHLALEHLLCQLTDYCLFGQANKD